MYITDETMQEIDAYLSDNATPPVDDDGFYFDRFIPENRVEQECVHENCTFYYYGNPSDMVRVFDYAECDDCGMVVLQND